MTIEELLEIEEIKKLRIMYSHYFDGGDLDNLAMLFAEDAVCEFGAEYGGDWVGRATIKKNYGNYATPDTPPHSFMHANTNPWIRLLDDTTANGRWYLLDLNLSPEAENPIALFGIYDDEYKKIDGKWYIQRTRIDFLWPRREFHGYRHPA